MVSYVVATRIVDTSVVMTYSDDVMKTKRDTVRFDFVFTDIYIIFYLFF